MMLKPSLRIIQDSNQILQLTKIKELEHMQKLQPLSFVGLHCWLKKNKRFFRGNKYISLRSFFFGKKLSISLLKDWLLCYLPVSPEKSWKTGEFGCCFIVKELWFWRMIILLQQMIIFMQQCPAFCSLPTKLSKLLFKLDKHCLLSCHWVQNSATTSCS